MAVSNRIPVGATPRSPYTTWDDHREALHRDAVVNRSKRLALRT